MYLQDILLGALAAFSLVGLITTAVIATKLVSGLIRH